MISKVARQTLSLHHIIRYFKCDKMIPLIIEFPFFLNKINNIVVCRLFGA